MSTLAQTYFRLAIVLDAPDVPKFKRYLADRCDVYARGLFQTDPRFDVEIEQGSLRGWLIAAGVIYAAIAKYGDFRTGVDYLVHDARWFSERVLEDIHGQGLPDDVFIRTERRLGVPGRLKRVLSRIDYLQEHGRALSKSDYSHEVHSLHNQVSKILKTVDDRRSERRRGDQQASGPRLAPARRVARASGSLVAAPEHDVRARSCARVKGRRQGTCHPLATQKEPTVPVRRSSLGAEVSPAPVGDQSACGRCPENALKVESSSQQRLLEQGRIRVHQRGQETQPRLFYAGRSLAGRQTTDIPRVWPPVVPASCPRPDVSQSVGQLALCGARSEALCPTQTPAIAAGSPSNLDSRLSKK